MEPTLIIALAALALSILSPIFTAWISGRYRLKEKALDMAAEENQKNQAYYEEHRSAVIERFINSTLKVCRWSNSDNLSAFGESSGEIYLYVDQSLWTLIDTINESIDASNYKQAEITTLELCKRLSKYGIRNPNCSNPDSADK